MQLREEVVSSNIKSIGWEDNNLFVEYLAGTNYKFKNVPESLYEDFKKAESKGKFFNQYVKNQYEFEKVV